MDDNYSTVNTFRIRQEALQTYNDSIKQGETFDDCAMEVVKILGGIDSIIEHYLQPENERLNEEQLSRLKDLFVTPEAYRMKHVANPTSKADRSAAIIKHQHAAGTSAENYKVLIFDYEKEQYSLNAYDTYLYMILGATKFDKAQSILKKFWFHFTVFCSLFVLYPFMYAYYEEFGFPIYVLLATALIWTPYLVLFLLAANRKAFGQLIADTFSFWMRIMYLLYGYIAAVWYYFGIQTFDKYEYPTLQMLANICLASMIALILCVVTMLDIIYMPAGNKLELTLIVPIIATYVWFALQFFTIESDGAECMDLTFVSIYNRGFSLNSIMINAANVLMIVLWKQFCLTIYYKAAGRNRHKAVIVMRNSYIDWIKKQTYFKQHNKLNNVPSENILNAKYDTYHGDDDDEDHLEIGTVAHKTVAIDAGEVQTMDDQRRDGSVSHHVDENEYLTADEGVITFGDKVEVMTQNGEIAIGLVQFVGIMTGKIGVYYGVEVEDEKFGENNGTLDNVKYFETKNNANTGLFCEYGKTKVAIVKKNSDVSVPRVFVNSDVNVKTTTYESTGKVQFIGCTAFKSGLWYGVALNEERGSHNGTIDERVYFKCKQKHGVFVKAKHLSVV